MEGSNASQSGNDSGKNESSVGRRFGITFAWTFVAFGLTILATLPKGSWVVGIIGSGLFALLAGVIAMAIRTDRKIVYVPISLLICVIIAYIIGTWGTQITGS